MNKLDQKFISLKQRNEKALIPFFTYGYPDEKVFPDLVQCAADSGVDVIEIGIPFSDPLADGPSIQFSSNVALGNHLTLKKSLELISDLSNKLDQPLVLLTYANPIYQYGLGKFAADTRDAGGAGVIVADLVIEEADRLENVCRSFDLDLIYLIAPTTNGDRLKSIAKRSQGFIYLVSVTGITGARKTIPLAWASQVSQIRKITDKPICVGFGISTPAQARRTAQIGDGVIVGSALVDLIRASKHKQQMLKKVSSFLVSLKKGRSS